MKNNFKEQIRQTIVEVSNLGLSDKGTQHAYEYVYPDLLNEYCEKNNNILEIGIAEGGGLLILSQLFPESVIYGIDINCSNLKIKTDNTNIKILSEIEQTKINIYDLPNLDIVIDDASHKLDNTIKTFEILVKKLNSNAIYIIEDIQPEQLQYYQNDKRFVIHNLTHIKHLKPDDIIAIYKNK